MARGIAEMAPLSVRAAKGTIHAFSEKRKPVWKGR